MNYNITGKHIELTPAMKEAVLGALEHPKRVHDGILNVHVFLSHEQHTFIAEAVMHVAGKNIVVKGIEKNMYDAISSMGDKAAHSLQKDKEKHSKPRHYSPKRQYQDEEI